MSAIWPLPKVTFTSLNAIEEKRPVALLTSDLAWQSVGHLLNLPLVVQAEPMQEDQELTQDLADNLPSQAEVVYVVGNGAPIVAGKVVASANQLPLVLVPTALDSDAIFESFVVFMKDGLLTRLETGPVSEVIIDWSVIEAAPAYERTAAIADLLAVVTALLDWRYAAKFNKTSANEKFSAWGAMVAAGLASQAIKSAPAIGRGEVEAMRTLIDLLMVSVQLAHQLGHDRHQEGTEHYFAYTLQNRGVTSTHAEMVGPGILFASALHGQDPSSLQEALVNAGVRLDQLRAGDVQLGVSDLPGFCVTNNLPYGIAHDLDPLSDQVRQALEKAGYAPDPGATGGWTAVNLTPAGEKVEAADIATFVSSPDTTPSWEDTVASASSSSTIPAAPAANEEEMPSWLTGAGMDDASALPSDWNPPQG